MPDAFKRPSSPDMRSENKFERELLKTSSLHQKMTSSYHHLRSSLDDHQKNHHKDSLMNHYSMIFLLTVIIIIISNLCFTTCHASISSSSSQLSHPYAISSTSPQLSSGNLRRVSSRPNYFINYQQPLQTSPSQNFIRKRVWPERKWTIQSSSASSPKSVVSPDISRRSYIPGVNGRRRDQTTESSSTVDDVLLRRPTYPSDDADFFQGRNPRDRTPVVSTFVNNEDLDLIGSAESQISELEKG